jgi:hypothetical protein
LFSSTVFSFCFLSALLWRIGCLQRQCPSCQTLLSSWSWSKFVPQVEL